jgi:hypothetical protein
VGGVVQHTLGRRCRHTAHTVLILYAYCPHTAHTVLILTLYSSAEGGEGASFSAADTMRNNLQVQYNTSTTIHSIFTHYTLTIHSLHTHHTLTIHSLAGCSCGRSCACKAGRLSGPRRGGSTRGNTNASAVLRLRFGRRTLGCGAPTADAIWSADAHDANTDRGVASASELGTWYSERANSLAQASRCRRISSVRIDCFSSSCFRGR